MTSAKVRAIFHFIDYLEENKKEYVEKYIPLTKEIRELNILRNELDPQKNYKDKQRYDSIQKKIADKAKLISDNVTLPLLEELKNLGIWDGDKIYTSIYNNNIKAVLELTKNFTSSDIEEVEHQLCASISSSSGRDVQCSTLVHNFNNILSNGHLYGLVK